MMIQEMKPRRCDPVGCGHYGAPRGSRVHEGVDLLCRPGGPVCPGIYGRVTKLGWVYSDDAQWRYVEVSAGGYAFRYFYVEPGVKVGEDVTPSTSLGAAQDISRRYPGAKPHIHFEIQNPDGNEVDPTPVLIAMGNRED